MRVLLSFSLPMLVGNIVQQFYSMVDLMIVGRFIGVNALAAVGACGAIMFLMLSLVTGLTNGAAVVVSQYFGAGDKKNTRRSVATSLWILGIVAIFLTVVGAITARPLLELMGTPAQIIDEAWRYIFVIFLGIIATVAYNLTAALIRAVGDSTTPLIFLVIAMFLNIGLDFLFIVGFKTGVIGAAFATVIAQGFSAIACIIYVYKRIPILRINRDDFTLDKEIVSHTIRIGLPGGLQNSLIAAGAMVVQSLVNSFGPVIIAAQAAAANLDQLAIQTYASLSMAMATYTAQNIGAGKIERVKKGFWSATQVALLFGGLLVLIMYLFGESLLTIFIDKSETLALEVGVGYLRIVAPFYASIGILFLLYNTLRGAGDVIPQVISCAVEIVVRVAIAYFLADKIGYVGIWWAMPISWVVGVIICGARYLSGTWKYKGITVNRNTLLD